MGCNVHARNSSGGADTTNGTSNLIVGYNEDLSGGGDRSGSHNLVVGWDHTYSSYGGAVIGQATARRTAPIPIVTGAALA